jgi:hypothetical protein
MCDYSLHNVASRPAKVGDKLVTTKFDFLTRGFAAIGEPNVVRGHTETCINVLVGIVTNVDAPRAARIKAAKVLSNYIPVQEVQRLIRVHALRFPQLGAMFGGDL